MMFAMYFVETNEVILTFTYRVRTLRMGNAILKEKKLKD